MRQGDVVYFITKGVVRCGILVNQNNGQAIINYQNGKFKKTYKYKLCRVAGEIEGGINGRLGKGSDTSSNKGCDIKNGKVSGVLQPNKEGQGSSNKLFVGAWRIRNMA